MKRSKPQTGGRYFQYISPEDSYLQYMNNFHVLMRKYDNLRKKKEYTQIGNKHIKSSSTLLVIREIKIKPQ